MQSGVTILNRESGPDWQCWTKAPKNGYNFMIVKGSFGGGLSNLLLKIIIFNDEKNGPDIRP